MTQERWLLKVSIECPLMQMTAYDLLMNVALYATTFYGNITFYAEILNELEESVNGYRLYKMNVFSR